MRNKQIVYHFSVGREGGVKSIINQFIHKSEHTLFDHRIINLIQTEDKKRNIYFPSINEIVINYSKYDNLYYTLSKVKKNLDLSNAILACHDWMELAFVSCLGLSNPVIFFMHGDYNYYYETAIKNQNYINVFISPTFSIKNNLESSLPNRRNDIYLLPYPVQKLNVTPSSYSTISCAYYVSDITDLNKNFEILPKIDQALLKRGILINWHIGGGGMTRNEFLKKWPNYDSKRIYFYGYLTKEKLCSLLQASNVFILPSFQEGMPISLIEAMSSGLVPVISNSSRSLQEVIATGDNGFIIESNQVDSYLRVFELLIKDVDYFKKLSHKAAITGQSVNEAQKSIYNIENLIYMIRNDIKKRSPQKLYGSRLDNPLIPNVITKCFRKYLMIYNG